LSYRGDAYARVKEKNRSRLDEQVAAGRIRSLLKSKVQQIDDASATLALADGTTETLANDYVIVCAGGELPTPLLKSIGIRFETKFGKA
jgi:thioredoxin reductase